MVALKGEQDATGAAQVEMRGIMRQLGQQGL
jgi:hypothetical protein